MKRLSTGIPSLDEMTHGGLYEGSATLITGAPGTGKTTFGMQFIVAGVEKKEPGIVVTFEHFPEIIYRDALSFGWDFKKYEEEGLLKVIFTSPEVFKTELEKEMGLIDELTAEMGAKRILIDPVTYFQFMTEDRAELRKAYNSLINGVKRAELTSILTCEVPKLFGEEKTSSLFYIVDNIIGLRYVEIESQLRRALLVLKMRGSDHAKDIREFEITDKGVSIEAKFEGREGILTGTPKSITLAGALEEAFGGKRKEER
ncbi:MAG TPA: ATPase [Actinobacteria bacterium]|nr:ATPase [Actinomycetota bacterium]